jgi:ribonuclease-3
VKIDKFQTILNYQFKHLDLLEQALTHRSCSRSKNNERLEFLGDSVLNMVISQHIYQREPGADEGDLSRIRASLVNEEALAQVARDFALGDFIYLGGGELKSGGFRRSSILSDTLEAIIGAIYLDSGFEQARDTILFLYRNYLRTLPDTDTLKDAKTRLQEYLQSKQLDLPEYTVIKTTGKSHDQVFTVSCSVTSLQLQYSGTGSSRKKAEQSAAKQTLDQLRL